MTQTINGSDYTGAVAYTSPTGLCQRDWVAPILTSWSVPHETETRSKKHFDPRWCAKQVSPPSSLYFGCVRMRACHYCCPSHRLHASARIAAPLCAGRPTAGKTCLHAARLCPTRPARRPDRPLSGCSGSADSRRSHVLPTDRRSEPVCAKKRGHAAAGTGPHGQLAALGSQRESFNGVSLCSFESRSKP